MNLIGLVNRCMMQHPMPRPYLCCGSLAAPPTRSRWSTWQRRSVSHENPTLKYLVGYVRELTYGQKNRRGQTSHQRSRGLSLRFGLTTSATSRRRWRPSVNLDRTRCGKVWTELCSLPVPRLRADCAATRSASPGTARLNLSPPIAEAPREDPLRTDVAA